MARARSLKPAFFKNAELVELPPLTRLLFAGLWTIADREGRIEDRPKHIKLEVLPGDECDAKAMLAELESFGFITRYEVDGVRVILINNFAKHQKPHHMESPSELPPPPGSANKFNHAPVNREQRARIMERDGGKCRLCGSTERPSIDHIIPVANGGTSDDSNLRVLCLPCNSRKGKKLDGEYTVRDRVDVESNTSRDQVKIESTNLRVDVPVPLTLNPIPHSLNPEPLTGNPEPATDACVSDLPFESSIEAVVVSESETIWEELKQVYWRAGKPWSPKQEQVLIQRFVSLGTDAQSKLLNYVKMRLLDGSWRDPQHTKSLANLLSDGDFEAPQIQRTLPTARGQTKGEQSHDRAAQLFIQSRANRGGV